MVTKRPVQEVAPVAPPTAQSSPLLKSPMGSRKKENTSPLLHLKKGICSCMLVQPGILLCNSQVIWIQFLPSKRFSFDFIKCREQQTGAVNMCRTNPLFEVN